jgi:hypothetical protein
MGFVLSVLVLFNIIILLIEILMSYQIRSANDPLPVKRASGVQAPTKRSFYRPYPYTHLIDWFRE